METIDNWEERTILQIGENNCIKLHSANILVAGLGGVGSYAAEMLCRAGIGAITIVDGDIIHPSNINRQLPALHSTVGQKKATVMANRLRDINPDLSLTVIDEFIKDERIKEILQTPYDYVVDAIDTLSPKVYLIYQALQRGLSIVSSMGAGGKYNPLLITIADISDSYNCKFARIVRKRLHKLGVEKGFKVIFSPEEVSPEAMQMVYNEPNKRSTVGTLSYMPAVFGCYCASVVINDLIVNK
jgi:tRNA A37 threonylcarbamoyladenosine dehydratase